MLLEIGRAKSGVDGGSLAHRWHASRLDLNYERTNQKSVLQPNSPILALFLIHIMHERKFLVLPANPFQAVGELASVRSVGLYPLDQSMSSSPDRTSSYTHTQWTI